MKTQKSKLLNRLSTGKNLTVTEAVKRLGVNRVSARIFELREEGYNIQTNTVKRAGNKVTAYQMQPDN